LLLGSGEHKLAYMKSRDAQYSLLEELATAALERRAAEEALRRRAAAALNDGVPQQAVATVLGVTQSAVSQMMSSYREARLGGGTIGRRVLERRGELVRVARTHGASRLRVFGSVADGREGEASDLDLIVLMPRTPGLLAVSALGSALAEVVGVEVDVIPESFVSPRELPALLASAVPL